MYSGGLAQVGVHSLAPRELLTLGSRFWTWRGCPGSSLKCYGGGLALCGFFPDSALSFWPWIQDYTMLTPPGKAVITFMDNTHL